MKKITAVLFFLLCCYMVPSQNVVCKHFTSPYATLLSSVTPTSDHGFIIAGYTTSYGAGFFDIYLLKLDSLYNLQWTKTIGDSLDDKAISIIQAYDGGYVMTGYSNDANSSPDLIVVKIDSAGNHLWTRVVGGTSSDLGSKIIQLSDSSLLAVGYTLSYGRGSLDAYAVKLDANGNVLWTRTIGGSAGDMGLACMQNADGDIVITGMMHAFGDIHMSLIKLDQSGNLLLTKGIGIAGLTAISYGITGTSDGGYMMAGALISSANAYSSKIYIVRTDSIGNIMWTKITGGQWDERLFSVVRSHDGYYYSAGRAMTDTSGIGTYIYRVMKWDESGNVIWSKAADNNYANTNIEIAEGADGHFIIPGSGPLSAGFITIDPNGNGCCTYDYITPDTTGGSEINFGILDSGGVVTQHPFLFFDGGMLVTDCSTTPVNGEENKAEDFNVYPNPAKDELIISSPVSGRKKTIGLFNMTGQPVYEEPLISEKQIIPVSALKRGMYILKVASEEDIITRKIILQ